MVQMLILRISREALHFTMLLTVVIQKVNNQFYIHIKRRIRQIIKLIKIVSSKTIDCILDFEKTVEELIKNGAIVNLKDENDKTAREIAESKGELSTK